MSHLKLSLPVMLAGDVYDSFYDLAADLLGRDLRTLVELTYLATNRAPGWGAEKLALINRLLGCAAPLSRN